MDPVYLDAFALFVKHEERYFHTYPFIVKDISVKKDVFIEQLVNAYEQSIQLLGNDVNVDDDIANNNNVNNDDDDDIQVISI